MNKKAVMGDWASLIFHLVWVVIVGVAVFGISSIFYSHYVDVRDAEALILSKQIANCISKEGVVDLEKFSGSEREILSFCEIGNIDRFYVSVELYDSNRQSIKNFSQGDSGTLWIRDFYEKISDEEDQYMPGYFEIEYPSFVNLNGNLFEANVRLEVLVNDEF